MRKWWLVLTIVALLATGCGGSDSDSEVAADGSSSSSDDASDDSGDAEPTDGGDNEDTADGSDDQAEPDPEPEPEPDPDFSGSDSDDFCDIAREFDENDPLEDLSFLDGSDFFDAADELWNGILPKVPDEIRADVEVIVANFGDMRAIAEKYDYDFMSDEAFAEMDALDTSEMDQATARFDAYLEDVCGITRIDTSGDDVPALDLDDLTDQEIESAAALVAQIFNLDIETAECLVEELGDFSDPGAVDFSRLDEPICGTTLNEVLAGIG